MKFLLDENLSPKLLAHFPGAVHIYDTLTAGTSDEEIFSFAKDQGLTIITGDTDFGALLAAKGDSRPSVLLVRALLHLPADQQAKLIVANLPQILDALREGAIVAIAESGIRVRPLPIT